MHTNNIESMIEIFAETVTLNQLFQILVGSGNNSYIYFYRGVTTDSIEFTIGQHSQQASLCFRRHITNLIQKQGSAIGLLKASLSALGCAGKGTFFMAK